jgi:drug/metabolite transporter (DMT)-like permease
MYAPGPPPPVVLSERRSPGMMIAGIALAGLGGVGLAGGAILVLNSDVVIDCSPGFACQNHDSQRATGYALMLVGAAGIAVGIPLIVIGAKRVPVGMAIPGDPGAPPPPPQRPPLPPAVEAKLGFGPGQAKLAVTF